MRCDDERARLQKRAIGLMLRAKCTHHRIIENRIGGMGVHHAQHRMLMQVSHMGQTMSQKEIAAEMDVSPACVARTLKSLETGGYIRKTEGEADGRCNEISLTPMGQRVVDESHELFRQIDTEVFAGFADEEICALIDLIGRMRQNMAQMEDRKKGAAAREEV